MQEVEFISVPSKAALLFDVGLNNMQPNVTISMVGFDGPTTKNWGQD